ncbi:hypothetical protein [Embleya sp. NPDC005575]|uniref:hypothetical protein n=1 Tax=Embleya sp. NPDC005575 TaxID=3156892 RepID=UPI0033A7BA1D
MDVPELLDLFAQPLLNPAPSLEERAAHLEAMRDIYADLCKEDPAAARHIRRSLLPEMARKITRSPETLETRFARLSTRQGWHGATIYTDGRTDRGHYAGASGQARAVVVTARGHHHRAGDPMDLLHNDLVCRACGAHGHWERLLDRVACPAPATPGDILRALVTPVTEPFPVRAVA